MGSVAMSDRSTLSLSVSRNTPLGIFENGIRDFPYIGRRSDLGFKVDCHGFRSPSGGLDKCRSEVNRRHRVNDKSIRVGVTEP